MTELDELTIRLFDIIGNPEGWQEFLAYLRHVTHSSSTSLFTAGLAPPDSQGLIVGLDSSAVQTYFERFQTNNPWVTAPNWRAPRDGQVLDGAAVVPLAELRRTEYYADFGRPNQAVHTVACIVAQATSHPIYISVNNAESDARPHQRAKDLLEVLAPRLARASAAMARLDLLALAEATGSASTAAVLVLDRALRILAANPVAARLLDRQHLVRRDEEGRLDLGSPATEAELRALLASPETTRAFAVHSQTARYPALARKVHAAIGPVSPSGAALQVTILPCGTPPDLSPHLLREAYGLTDAEVEFACQFVQTGSLPGVLELRAQQGRRVSRSTLKTHLESIFFKTGTNKQAELIQLLTLVAVTF